MTANDPDILKRTQSPVLLDTDVLVKAINDEYSQILASERNNLQKALAIGEKLVALRPRIAPKHGKWQVKLAEHCPQISYETATLYIRLYENQDGCQNSLRLR